MKNTNWSVRTGDVVHAWSACENCGTIKKGFSRQLHQRRMSHQKKWADTREEQDDIEHDKQCILPPCFFWKETTHYHRRSAMSSERISSTAVRWKKRISPLDIGTLLANRPKRHPRDEQLRDLVSQCEESKNRSVARTCGWVSPDVSLRTAQRAGESCDAAGRRTWW